MSKRRYKYLEELVRTMMRADIAGTKRIARKLVREAVNEAEAVMAKRGYVGISANEAKALAKELVP